MSGCSNAKSKRLASGLGDNNKNNPDMVPDANVPIVNHRVCRRYFIVPCLSFKMKEMRPYRLITLSICLLCFNGCMSLARYYVGLSEPSSLSNEKVSHYAKKNRINEENSFLVDTSYIDKLLEYGDFYHPTVKNHYQPVQASIYNDEKKLFRFFISCYAYGLYKIKWNYEGIFNSFPPDIQAPIDSIIPFELLKSSLIPTTKKTLPIDTVEADYTIIIFWTKATKRHSKGLIKQIRSNISLADSSITIAIIYANYDNVLYKMKQTAFPDL